MALLRGLNYDFSGQPMSSLKDTVASGATTLTVENTEGFTDDDYLIIDPRSETSEIVRIDDTVSKKTTLTITATKFAHSAKVKVYRTSFNQIRFYESTTTDDDGTWNVVDTVDMDFSDLYTKYNYSDVSNDLYYRRTFYNSTTFVESAIELSISWQTNEEKLYVTPEEMRTFLQFDKNDFPSPADMRFFIKIAMGNISLDLESSNDTILFIATLYQTKHQILRSLATKSLSKGYIQVNAEGRTITKAYQELVLEAENTLQEYKEFLLKNGRREVTSTNFMDDTTLVDSWTRRDMINIMNGTSNAMDAQSRAMRTYFDGMRSGS